MRASVIWTCLLFLMYSTTTSGQENANDDTFQSLLEDTFSFQDAEVSTELYETLLLYYSHPLDLNKVSADELRTLYILTETQVESFIKYRSNYGRLLSKYELQAIPNFDLVTIYKLLPFVKILDSGLQADTRPLLQRIWAEPNNYLLLRYQRTLEEKKGYIQDAEGKAKYRGSPDHLLARFRIRHAHDFSLGFTVEKDAGEALEYNKANHTYGADFYSLHFQLQDKGKLKNLVLGDYQIQFGQSLLFAAGFNVGKGSETITTTRRSNLGILPYTSTIETNYFRGAAATYALNKKFDLTGFYSRVNQDASILSDTLLSDDPFINALKTSGLHRTNGEIAAKKQVIQQSAGGNILYHDDESSLQIGLSMVTDHFSNAIAPSGEPYKYYDFSGQHNHSLSLSANYNWQSISFFGEVGRSKSGGLGAIGGFMTHLTPTLQTSIVLRDYARDFHSLHGQAFGESAGNKNERGWYWGLKYLPSRKYQLTAYFDRFSFPWLKFRIDAPTSGYEYLGRFNYRPNRKTNFYIQFRQESKARNAPDVIAGVNTPINNIKRGYIFNLDYDIDKTVSIKSRVQFGNYKQREKITKGFAIIQDLNIDLRRFRLSTRFALFDTDDYENRQYAYERDVLYGFSIPPYSGSGTRQYVVLQYKATRKIDLWLRYACTHYRDRDKISSGLEEIDGNIKTDIKLQTRIKF